MSNLRLKDRRIDFILDLNDADAAESLQAGFRQLLGEGAVILPRLLVKEKTRADYNLIKKILDVLGVTERDIVREIVFDGCLCRLYEQKTDLLFLLTGSEFFLLKINEHLQKACSCKKDSCITGDIPVVIALIPGYNTLNFPGAVSPLLCFPRIFWVPFGWSFTSGFKLKVFSRTDLWDETCVLALEGKQIEPFFIETPGSGLVI